MNYVSYSKGNSVEKLPTNTTPVRAGYYSRNPMFQSLKTLQNNSHVAYDKKWPYAGSSLTEIIFNITYLMCTVGFEGQ